MSLRSKMEAVIYAAEDPVTLQQLVGLFAQEAQAQLDQADALQGQLALTETDPLIVQPVDAGDADALNAEIMGTEAFPSVMPLTESEELEHEAPLAAEESYPADGREQGEVAQTPPVVTPQEEIELSTEAPSSTAEGSSSDAPATGADPAVDTSLAAQRARDRRLREYMRSLLDELVAEYRDSDRGLEIREVAGGFRFATKPEYHDAVRGFVRSLKPPLKLSLQALETLAVVAYKQPVTAPEVSEIRGVDSAGVMGSLITRKLVTTAGRKQVIGRPILYKTTKEFLLRFGLKDVNELPSIEEFERLASEINEAVQEEIPMPPERLDQMQPTGSVGDAPRDLEPMRNEHAAQADGTPGETDAEHLTPPPDGPGEFTGDETVPPADNTTTDGRISGLPPNYDEPTDEAMDSPALDAEVQGDAAREGEI